MKRSRPLPLLLACALPGFGTLFGRLARRRSRPLRRCHPTSDLKLKPPPSTAKSGGDTGAPAGHPLKGVIVEILTAKSALLVKHDEIPGVMSAMTMLLKVDAPTLAAAKKGQSITATLIKKTNGWWLETVTPLAAP